MKTLTPALDAAFVQIYISDDWRSLTPAAAQFFGNGMATRDTCDNFFENFTPVWKPLLDVQNYAAAEHVWERALEPAITWEQSNPGQLVHKGTALYFWGVTALHRGDLDRGYLLVHQALEEDKREWGTITPTKPAFALVSLDAANAGQWFRQWVLDQAAFLSGLINSYSTAYTRVLDFPEFRKRFPSTSTNLETLFLFAHSVARLMQLKKVLHYSRLNPFAGQLEANVLFDIVLVIDAAIKEEQPAAKYFPEQAEILLAAAHQPLKAQQIKDCNQFFTSNFDATVAGILNRTFQISPRGCLTDFQRNALLAYGIRNRGAHDVSSSPIYWQRFDEIQQAVFNVLFGAIDYLY